MIWVGLLYQKETTEFALERSLPWIGTPWAETCDADFFGIIAANR